MKNSTIGIIIVIILLALGFWYFTSNKTPAASTTPTATVDTGASSPATGAPAGGMETGTVSAGAAITAAPVKDIAVSGTNFAFSPKTITVKKGDHVKITFTNTGGMHDFVIDEFNVRSARINGGESTVLEFDATKAGTFQYYCSVSNHRAMGMVGTLTITP